MTLRRVEGQPDLWRDPRTGNIINERDFQSFEKSSPFSEEIKDELEATTMPKDARWFIDAWHILVECWDEDVMRSMEVEAVFGMKWFPERRSCAPLIRIAHPLNRSLLIEQRLERMEKMLEIGATALYEGGRLEPMLYVQEGEPVYARLVGPKELLEKLGTMHLVIRGRERRVNKLRAGAAGMTR